MARVDGCHLSNRSRLAPAPEIHGRPALVSGLGPGRFLVLGAFGIEVAGGQGFWVQRRWGRVEPKKWHGWTAWPRAASRTPIICASEWEDPEEVWRLLMSQIHHILWPGLLPWKQPLVFAPGPTCLHHTIDNTQHLSTHLKVFTIAIPPCSTGHFLPELG